MRFLQDTDYLSIIPQNIRDRITKEATVVESAERMAQAEIESFLNLHYDTTEIFNKTDTDRNPFIVRIMVDISLYHLYSSISPNAIAEIRQDRYEQAYDWLKMVGKGQLSPDLPRVDTDGDGTPDSAGFSYGSNTKRNNYF